MSATGAASASALAELAALPNLGPASARMLVRAGIHSKHQLQQLGALQAYLTILNSERNHGQRKPSLNLLWALAGALQACHWNQLPAELRSALLLALDAQSDFIE